MITLKKIIENVVSNSQLDDIPLDIRPVSFFVWTPDIDDEKDWDDFIGGQLVCHNYWDEVEFRGMIDITNLQFGNNPTSFYGMLNYNEQITVYTSNYLDLSGKFITIGDNIDNFYYCQSFELNNFQFKKKTLPNNFYGKLILINIQKFLDNQFNDSNQAPTINVVAGKINEDIKVPIIKKSATGEIADNQIVTYETGTKINDDIVAVEIFLPEPAIFIGGGVDFVKNDDRKGSASADKNKLIPISLASSKPHHFAINPYYCILPTQFNIPSIDNYGWTHPADRSNYIKTLMSTQTLGSAANTALSGGGGLGLIGKAGSIIGSALVGTGQKFFGNKGTLANSTAINSSFLSGEGDPIKFFIQGDGCTSGGIIDENGYLNLSKLAAQNDYMEINQANGEFGKYGKSMSPSRNSDFDQKTVYRGLGLDTIALANSDEKILTIATPFTGSGYEQLKITDDKINTFLKTGAPRLNINNGDLLKPMIFPETWDVYIRNMFFRPDPYSFWNWPCITPAEVGIWDVKKITSIGYDTTAIPDGASLLSFIGIENNIDNSANRPTSYWNKTITVSQITNNDLYDPNKTFSSFRYEFNRGDLNDLYQIQFTCITSSTISVKLINENDQVVREHKFNSQGRNIGTSASWGTIIQL